MQPQNIVIYFQVLFVSFLSIFIIHAHQFTFQNSMIMSLEDKIIILYESYMTIWRFLGCFLYKGCPACDFLHPLQFHECRKYAKSSIEIIAFNEFIFIVFFILLSCVKYNRFIIFFKYSFKDCPSIKGPRYQRQMNICTCIMYLLQTFRNSLLLVTFISFQLLLLYILKHDI